MPRSRARFRCSMPLPLRAARQWEFTPTIVDGKPARSSPVELNSTWRRRLRTPATTTPPALARRQSRSTPTSMRRCSNSKAEGTEDALKAFRQANDRRGQNCTICYVGMARVYNKTLGARRTSSRAAIAPSRSWRGQVSGDPGPAVESRRHSRISRSGKDPKRLREAEDELRAALSLDPTANYLHFNLGLVLLREGRDADGVAELKEELAIRPNGPQADRARSMIENPRRAREAFAPNFSVVTLDREFVDLGSLKGKVVLLDFWGTWCPPCVAAIPTLKDLQKRHAKDRFVLLSVSSDGDEAVVRTFTEKNRLDWPQYLGSRSQGPGRLRRPSLSHLRAHRRRGDRAVPHHRRRAPGARRFGRRDQKTGKGRHRPRVGRALIGRSRTR